MPPTNFRIIRATSTKWVARKQAKNVILSEFVKCKCWDCEDDSKAMGIASYKNKPKNASWFTKFPLLFSNDSGVNIRVDKKDEIKIHAFSFKCGT